MSLNITSLRRELREHCSLIGDDEGEIPNVDTADKTGADTYLNRAYWEILDKYKFREKEVIASFPTVSGTNFYHTPSSFESLQGLSIVDLYSDQHTPLDRITTDVYEQTYVGRTDAQGKPEQYVVEGDGIRLLPTPDNIYTIKIRYWSELADLSTGNIDPLIPRAWHEVILFGGVARAMMGATRDQNGALAARAWQQSLINGMSSEEEKEQIDSHRSGLEVLGREGEL